MTRWQIRLIASFARAFVTGIVWLILGNTLFNTFVSGFEWIVLFTIGLGATMLIWNLSQTPSMPVERPAKAKRQQDNSALSMLLATLTADEREILRNRLVAPKAMPGIFEDDEDYVEARRYN